DAPPLSSKNPSPTPSPEPSPHPHPTARTIVPHTQTEHRPPIKIPQNQRPTPRPLAIPSPEPHPPQQQPPENHPRQNQLRTHALPADLLPAHPLRADHPAPSHQAEHLLAVSHPAPTHPTVPLPSNQHPPENQPHRKPSPASNRAPPPGRSAAGHPDAPSTNATSSPPGSCTPSPPNGTNSNNASPPTTTLPTPNHRPTPNHHLSDAWWLRRRATRRAPAHPQQRVGRGPGRPCACCSGALVAGELVRVRAAAGRGTLVQRADRLDLLRGESQVQGGEVGDVALRCDRLRDHHVAQCQVPGQQHLGGIDAVGLGDLRDDRVLELTTALAQRRPGLGDDVLAGVVPAQLVLEQVGVQLDLVQDGHDPGLGLDQLQVLDTEVRDPDGADPALLLQLDQSLPGLQGEPLRGGGPVDQVQVQLVEAEVGHGALEGAHGVVVALVLVGD